VERIELDGVGKRYVVGEQKSAREAITDGALRLIGRRRSDASTDFWSLRDVSFSVGEGEALGIIGRNGAGKSTILKIITRITTPTTGVSRTRGRVAALLEVGTGFHPELTGRENIFLNGAILGMSRRDMLSRFDDIVEFSGVQRFLDTPVKRYSSGMGLRLGFSVAAHLEPDVLVVDEILAVGDAEFQRKCLGRMEEAEKEGRTLVFVSHDLDSLTRICTRGLWLEAGHVRDTGPAKELVREYLSSSLMSAEAGAVVISAGPLIVHGLRVMPKGRPVESALLREDTLTIEVDIELREYVRDLDLAIYLTSNRGVRVIDEALRDWESPRFAPGRYRVCMDVPPVLNVGDYFVGLWCGAAGGRRSFIHEDSVVSFTVHGSDRGRPGRAVVLDLPITVTPL
jgi:ABC-2 type transport system ATP-binding protein/lipopolysaccharide transport system ATP-binding protein